MTYGACWPWEFPALSGGLRFSRIVLIHPSPRLRLTSPIHLLYLIRSLCLLLTLIYRHCAIRFGCDWRIPILHVRSSPTRLLMPCSRTIRSMKPVPNLRKARVLNSPGRQASSIMVRFDTSIGKGRPSFSRWRDQFAVWLNHLLVPLRLLGPHLVP